MAFVVEDGTGKADSNSYGAVADADAYFTDRQVTDWAGTQQDKEGALIRATDYIEFRFGDRFIGTKKTDQQALSWPRSNAKGYADNVIPMKLQRACFEYALRALDKEPLAPDPELDASGMAVVTTREKVGPLETEFAKVQSGLGATVQLFRPYPAADALLKGLVYSSNRVIR